MAIYVHRRAVHQRRAGNMGEQITRLSWGVILVLVFVVALASWSFFVSPTANDANPTGLTQPAPAPTSAP